jgi:chloramphenicol O-acetyltransferase type A
MAETKVDLETWPRAAQFAWFRAYDRPHYATTVRLDVTHLITTRKPAGVSPYRACLYAIGCGLHAVPELRMRFRGDEVFAHDMLYLSMTVPTDRGAFNYAYVPFCTPFAAFDETAAQLISDAARSDGLNANAGAQDDVAYLSCMPWLDYTGLNNAMPGPDDCIPRVSWGKFVQDAAGRWRMAMTLEVHHALVDGAQVGAFFNATQDALDRI